MRGTAATHYIARFVGNRYELCLVTHYERVNMVVEVKV